MAWDIEIHEVVRIWLNQLSQEEKENIYMAIQVLRDRGPILGRPFVDHIKGSKIKNLKELRPPKTTIRILFAFDSRRRTILLTAGDKRGTWQSWYEKAIPEAERRYSVHRSEIRKGGM